MPIKHFVSHQINKDSQKPAALITVSEQEAEVDDYCHLVMSQLKQVFVGRASKRYGRFDPQRTVCKGLLTNWQRDQMNFTSWTSKLTDLFADSMDNSDLAFEGFLLFIAEELADSDRLYIFHLREKSNLCFDAEMKLSEQRCIDFSNTGFAICLDLTLMGSDDQKAEYLTFSFGRGDKAPQNLFCDFLGFTDTLDTEQETQEFLEIVEEFAEQLTPDEANEARATVIEYCLEQDKNGEAVEFSVLSSELSSKFEDNEPKKFEQFVTQKRKEKRQQRPVSESNPETTNETVVAEISTEPKNELIPDRKSLKNYIRYSGKNKEVTLSFAATALGADIVFDAGSESLTIKNLPAKLLKQLKQ